MKLFIFAPNPGWDYMGGYILVHTHSYEDAIRLIRNEKLEDSSFEFEDEEFYKTLEEIPLKMRDFDVWYLFKTVETNDNKEWIHSSYNHA